MGCKECGKPKCNGKCGCKSPKVLQINNPAEYITFHKVSIPAAMGDSTTNPPKIGAYRNALVYYEADHTSWMYSTDGIPTLVTGEQGETGPQGPAGTIAVGTTTTGEPGTDAEVENVGTPENAILNFTIPKGDKGDQGPQGEPGPQGPAGTITIGTTTTGEAGADAEVENVGTPENAILNFTIPRGEQGDQGPQGEPGPQGYMNEQDVRNVVDTIIPEGFFDDESTVSDCGTSFELENLAGGSPKSLRLNGDTFQQSYNGSNLIDMPIVSGSRDGITWVVNPDGSITLNGTATTTVSIRANGVSIPAVAGETYTLSATGLQGIVNFGYKNSDSGADIFVVTHSSPVETKQITSEMLSLANRLDMSIGSGCSFNNQRVTLQLEKGSTATSYEPFVGGQPSPSPEYPQPIKTVTGTQTISINGTNYPISLGSIELCKLGTYQDYIWKEGYFCKVHNTTVSAIIDGSENWSASGTNKLYVADIYSKIGNSIQSTSTGEMYASHFTIVDISGSNTLVGASLKVDAAHNLSNLRIRLQDMSGNTAGFRQMLSDKKPSIYARRLTPTDTTITDTNLIAQLEAIRLDTGVNAISISSDGLSGEICLEAFIGNWKGTISELKNQIRQIWQSI